MSSTRERPAARRPGGPQVPAAALQLGERFAAAGHELALVGGSVRDLILGRPVNDLDFTTDARPEQTEQVIAGWADATWDVGRAFGTIGARHRDDTVEITTYRAEAYASESRKPEVAYGESLDDDLVRRDFTINAMALALPAQEFVDPYGGLQDLAAGLIRTPGTPQDSFSDDPLRMLRAARFAAQLGFEVAPEVVAAMSDMAERLSIVSAERVRDELTKLVCAAHPRLGLTLLVDTGLADVVLPELPALRLERDEHHRHKDVYEHTLTVLEQAIDLEDDDVPGPDLVLRLAALLHDIGKPATRRFEPGGGVSFHHHEVVGAKLAAKRLKALRYDKDTVKAVARLVELHLRFHGYGTGEWTDSAVRRYVTDAGPLLSRLHKLTRSDSTTRNARKAARLARTYDDLETRIARLMEAEELAAIRPELDGEQIMAALGLRPGPVVGRAYQHLLQVRLDQGLLGEDAARAELLRWWADQPESTAPTP
ncbi:CCA tRNA nucleotidyltransferase [Angustibacter sp. Root456]|nr:CCA tRNA nucleotidyltransferase [Angustibacter sp. Root456]KQX61877.1 CCA tRNA nucleotidyltransferase [Angustibacter sp. Root456]